MSLFNFFKSDPEAQARREAFLLRQNTSIASLKAGGLPLNATERLNQQRARQNTPEHLWTSDLSVNEMLLARREGVEMLGQVLGASIYHVGTQWRNQLWQNSVYQNGASYELDVQTKANTHARKLALQRLQQEAALLGADGVVGVRIERRRVNSEEELVEFFALGTAIRLPNTAPNASKTPWLCNLSGQEFWALLVSGFEPVGVVAGNASFFCAPSLQTERVLRGGWLSTVGWRNVEIEEFTRTTYTARETAQGRMAGEARALNASGVVGVQIEHETRFSKAEIRSNERRECLTFHFWALATAIRPSGNTISETIPRGLTIVPLKTKG